MARKDFAYSPLVGINADIAKHQAQSLNTSEGMRAYVEAVNRDAERDYQSDKLSRLRRPRKLS